MKTSAYYLPEGLPVPRPARDRLDEPYYQGLQSNKLVIQRCNHCNGWQWGPEWICHRCLSMDLGWAETAASGRIYSWERVWHPVHPALKDHGPYIVVLVELPEADGIRLVGNLLGDPRQPVDIGAEVNGIFEHHEHKDGPFTLLQWQLTA